MRGTALTTLSDCADDDPLFEATALYAAVAAWLRLSKAEVTTGSLGRALSVKPGSERGGRGSV